MVKQTVTVWHNNSTPEYIPKRIENTCPHKNCTQMFLAAVSTIAKKWKQPESSWTDDRLKIYIYSYNELLFSNKKA